MTAPAYGTGGTLLSGSGGTASFAVPASVAADDIIVIPFFLDGGSTTVTAMPTGFAHAENSPVTGANHSLNVVWKRATGADAGTYDFTFSASAYREGAAHRYTGATTSGTPFDTGTGHAVDNTSGSGVSPPVSTTTLGTDRRVLLAATCWAGGSWTPPASYTERQDAAGSVGLCTLDDIAQAAAGGTGSVSATCTNSDKRTAWIGGLIPATSLPSAAPNGLAIPVALGTPTASLVGATPTGLAIPVALGTPTATLGLTAAPAGLAIPVGLGTPTASLAGAAPNGLAIPVALGTPTVSLAGATPDGLAIPVSLGSPAAVTPVTPTGIAIPVTLGDPAVGATVSTLSGGSWWTLGAIAAENRAYIVAEQQTPPVACPNDGEPLQTDPRSGKLRCHFDGWMQP